MTVPNFQDLTLPVLDAAADQEVSITEVVDKLADRLHGPRSFDCIHPVPCTNSYAACGIADVVIDGERPHGRNSAVRPPSNSRAYIQ